MPRRYLSERDAARAARFSTELSDALHAGGIGHRELAAALGISRFTVDSWTRAGDPALPGERNLAQLCDYFESRQGGLGARLAAAAEFVWTPEATVPSVAPTDPLEASGLPAAMTSFIGRQHELAEARRLLGASRLLTIAGPGGVGKTRLALELAYVAAPDFAGGVRMVELAPIAAPDFILPAIAAALGVPEQPGASVEDSVRRYLRDRPMLLLLDNCEHLIDACAKLADMLLRACPRLKLLATSREPLAVIGETAFRIPPLSLPMGDDAAPSEAVQLFVARAQAAQPRFDLTPELAPVVVDICRRLDGMPLAIELAAALVRALSPRQIAARLDDRFRLLSGGRSAVPRQQTLQAAIDWSYNLLAVPEQALLRLLAIFTGGWSLEAAEQVDGGSDVVARLTRLVDTSLVRVESDGDELRYGMYETIRQYMLAKLDGAAEEPAARDRHLAYFDRYAQTLEAAIRTAAQAHAYAAIETDLDNFRAAMEWALHHDPVAALRLVAALQLFWQVRGGTAEGIRWGARALEAAGTKDMPGMQAARITLLIMLAELLYARSDWQAALHYASQAVAQSRAINDPRLLGLALTSWGFCSFSLGGVAGARAVCEEALTLLPQSEPFWRSYTLGVLSQVYGRLGDFPSAAGYLRDSLAMARQAGAPFPIGMGLMTSGTVLLAQGKQAEARQYLSESQSYFQQIGSRHMLNAVRGSLADEARARRAFPAAEVLYRATLLTWQEMALLGAAARCIECLAYVAADDERPERAARLLGAAAALRESAQAPMVPPEPDEYAQYVRRLRAMLGDTAFDRAYADGGALPPEHVTATALAQA